MAIDTEDQTAAAKKVKFLCSFGGKILPRPSDGALRYVGGQTRIISLPKTVSFPEMIQKMRDVYGGPVNLKYQLPEEDLDALVSVSCGEDVENMMEEYQKLARVTVDASPKLRVFLFAEGNGGAVTAFSGDSMGQSYIEAVNGIGQLRRKVCKSRSALTHTSDGILLANVGDESRTENCGGMDGVSSMASAVQCPSVQDGSNLISSVAAVSRSESVRAETRFSQSQIMASVQMDALISADVRPEPTVPGLITPETPTSASIAGYVLPTYKDQQQDVFNHVSSVPNCGHVQCLSSQHLVFGGAPVQFVTLDQHSHMPGTSISTVPLSPVPFLDTVKPSTSMLESCLDGTFLGPVRPSTSRLDSCLDGSEYGKLGKVPSESSHKAFQSLAQLPPIPPLLVQASHIDGYGGMYAWPQVTPPSHQAQQVSAAKLEECLTYQNAPSHVLSGTVIHDNIGTVSQTSSVVHIKQNRNIPSSNDPYKYICAALTNVSVKRDNVTNVASTPGACGHHQIPMVQHEIGSIAHHKTENSHQYRLPLPSGSGGLPSDLLSLYESYPNHHTQATCEGSLRQKLHQHPPSVPGQHHSFRHISSTNPLCNGNTTARYGMLETFDPPSVYVRNDSIRPVDGLVEKLNLNRDKQMKIVEKSNGSSPEDLSENVALSSGNPNVQVEEGSLFPNNVSATRNISESHHSVPLSSVLEVPCLPNVHDLNSNKLPILLEDITELSDHPGIEAEPPIPHALLLGVSSATNQLCDNEQRENPLVHSGNCSKALSALSFSNLLSPPSNFSELNVGIQGTQQPTHSDSLFSGTDPLGILQNGHTILPNPLSVACKEPLFLEDSCIDKHLANGESLLSISSEGGVHHEPLDALKKKDLFSRLVPPVMDWTEKQIKKDMQDVVDDIGVSSLGPIVPHDPAGGHETGESSLVRKCDTCPHAEIVDPKGTLSIGDKKIEPEKIVYHGFLVTDDIGRLQIIKNSDLEELSELGSGMYGTVYHGKWKGSDVAIKWINNRCFAGKTSDAERLRADFWNEVRNLADLHHPNVVAFYGVVLDGPGESVATVTEYMVDGSLRRALQRNDKILDKRKRLLIAMDVAFGMEYLHGKNIVHFGLKSDNLLVNLSDHQRPICKVGDLGLSKVKRQTIISGSVRGTLPWMAPVLNGCSNLVSEKVDVFSFGIIMWELLSGEEPYANLHCGAIIGGVVNNTLRPPIPNSCDPGWKSLMEKCWSVEPSERPTFTEIVATLRSIATSLPKKEEA